MQQTFTVGAGPKVVIAHINGDLSVSVIDEQVIRVDADGRMGQLSQEGDTLMLIDCDGDLELQVPADTTISAQNLHGDASIQGVRRVELENVASDLILEDIGEAAEITNVGADLSVERVPGLRVQRGIGGDASIKSVELVEIEAVGGDFTVKHAGSVMVGAVGGDMSAGELAASLRCGEVGGDCDVHGGADTEVILGNVGGDLEVVSAARMQVGNVGGDCQTRDIRGAIELGYSGGDASFQGVGGNLEIGSIGGDAALKGVGGSIDVGAVGGDLSLQSAFPADSHSRINVGGDAKVMLPDAPNLSIRAAVGGDVSGSTVSASGAGNLLNLVYGEGAARLELNVGGDLSLRGPGSPRTANSSNASWGDFEREMSELGREMGRLGRDLGREMSKLGQDLARDIGTAGMAHGNRWTEEVTRKIEEQARRAERQVDEWARRMERQSRRAEERAARLNIRINGREWRMDPERLDRITEQARRAAAEGVSGAFEAVERAMRNFGVPVPPDPSMPPNPPKPPKPPRPYTQEQSTFSSAAVSEDPVTPAASDDIIDKATDGESSKQEEATATLDTPATRPEQEREAILRMIAEGRISPEEGDLLLESLGG